VATYGHGKHRKGEKVSEGEKEGERFLTAFLPLTPFLPRFLPLASFGGEWAHKVYVLA